MLSSTEKKKPTASGMKLMTESVIPNNVLRDT
jgi:hypothetical protein